jgi:S-adenosyl-L-methionine hydrolase (adenosine-forming)
MDQRAPIITLTSDFGLAYGTVGAMIGVIKSICPDAEVVNLASDIPAHDIPRGAWAIFQASPFFPTDTIHVVVVDPGVGSRRRGILAATDRGRFVGPDNGVLSWAWRAGGDLSLRALENPSYRIARLGLTFDGRDLFAPVAAHLALGADPATVGAEIGDPVMLPWPETTHHGDRIEGVIIVIDHFGNLITNITMSEVGKTFADQPFSVLLPGDRAVPFVGHYAAIQDEYGAVVNGSGLIEIAARERPAAALLALSRGARVMIAQGGNAG